MFSSQQIFTVDGDMKERLVQVLSLAYELLNTKSPACFYTTDKYMVFSFSDYDCESSKFQKYPFTANPAVLAEQIIEWLKSAEYGEQEDIDGSVYKGWEVFCPKWYGDDKIDPYTLGTELAVRPKWIYYHK